VVEGARLLSACGAKHSTEGSNPSLSASFTLLLSHIVDALVSVGTAAATPHEPAVRPRAQAFVHFSTKRYFTAAFGRFDVSRTSRRNQSEWVGEKQGPF